MSPSENVMDPTDPTGLSPPAPTSNTELSSPSTNRKRTRDEPSPLKPAKRQNSQPFPATGPEIAQLASQSNTDLPTLSYISQVGIVLVADQYLSLQPRCNSAGQNTESITRRISEYKSRLQTLEAEHTTISKEIDLEDVETLKRTMLGAADCHGRAVVRLNKIHEAIKHMTKAINDYPYVVPIQLCQALEAIKIDRDRFERELHNLEEVENKLRIAVSDAQRKNRDANDKLKELSKQIDRCRFDLRSAGQHLNDDVFQQKLDTLSRVDVSTFPYDQRLQLFQLVEQVTEILD